MSLSVETILDSNFLKFVMKQSKIRTLVCYLLFILKNKEDDGDVDDDGVIRYYYYKPILTSRTEFENLSDKLLIKTSLRGKYINLILHCYHLCYENFNIDSFSNEDINNPEIFNLCLNEIENLVPNQCVKEYQENNYFRCKLYPNNFDFSVSVQDLIDKYYSKR